MCAVNEEVCQARMEKVIAVEKDLEDFKNDLNSTASREVILDKQLAVVIANLKNLSREIEGIKEDLEDLKKPKSMNPILAGVIGAVSSGILLTIAYKILELAF